MAKHIFGNKELAHAFFHQDEFGIDWGRGSNFSFNGNRIYSYNSCIGIADFDKKIFLFRSASYSSSTCKHQSKTHYAIPDGWKNYYWKHWHNFESLEGWFQDRIEDLQGEKDNLNKGIKYFGRDIYDATIQEVLRFAKDLNCENLIDKYSDKLLALKWTEEDLEKYKIKSWARDNEMLGSYEKKKKYYLDTTLKALVEKKFQDNLADKEEKARQRALLLQQQEQEKLQKWLKWEYKDNLYNVPIHLRLGTFGEYDREPIVETTLGAKVPLSHCKLLYKKFRQCIETNTEWETNGHSIHIGNYKVSKIQQRLRNKYPNVLEWSIAAGCHLLFETEVEKFIVDNNLQSWRE